MYEIVKIDYKCHCIVHFQQDDRPMMRTVFYQVVWNPDNVSPGGEFIRFSSFGDEISEIHGWVLIEDIVLDEILEKIEVSEEVVEEEAA